MSDDDKQRHDMEIEQMRATTMKLINEAGKLAVEAEKMRKESVYYPIAIGATATLAVVAVLRLFV